MNARGLREHVLADNRFVRRHAPAREHFHELADVGQRALVHRRADARVIAQRDDDFVERDVAGPFAHAVHRHVHAAHAGDRGLEGVGGAEAVVVVPVIIEVAIGKLRDDARDEITNLRRRQQPERIGQHDAPHVHRAQRVDVLVDVVGRSEHAAGPVFQVHVERDAVLHAVLDRPADVVEVLRVRLLQLLAAVMQRALCQQINHARADGGGPVDRAVHVDEAENLHAIGHPLRLGVLNDRFHRASLALADASRGDLDAVHLHRFEQAPGDRALLLGHHRDAFGLLAVAQRRIHHLDAARFLLHLGKA